MCAAPNGNEFWKARAKHGREAIFSDPEILWQACEEYFEWVETNPLLEPDLVKFQGAATVVNIPRPRPFTVSGLCLFLEIDQTTWAEYRKNELLSETAARVDAVIKTQKFEGAAAGIFNPNIIARDLGLADKQHVSTSLTHEQALDLLDD